MPTFRDLLNQTKAEIREISPDEADTRRDTEPDTVFLDVREPDEFDQGAIEVQEQCVTGGRIRNHAV